MEDYKEMYENLSDEMKAKVASCKTSEELVNLAKSEGYELTDEQLDVVTGGSFWSDVVDELNSCKGWY